MKQLWKDICFSVGLGLLLPGLLLNMAVALRGNRAEIPEAIASVTEPTVTIPLPVRFRGDDGQTVTMDMDAYLVGVLLAEIPPYFEKEALKAQAVVARTYARRAWETGGKHGDGSVCGDSTCCQGYVAEESCLASGGKSADVSILRDAVEATSGQVLCYGGELIEATYFSCSGGRTEDALAVWGQDYPYLQSVDSPGEEEASHYTDNYVFSLSEFAAVLGINPPVSDRWLGTATYTKGGGIHTMVIGGKAFTGVELRSLLGLRSTAITMERQGDSIHITTRGYGHRVGMSQYGADAMAVAGSDYREILAHYYQGTQLTWLEGEFPAH